MKRTFILLALVLLVATNLQSAPVDVNRAKALGIAFMKTNTEIKSASAELTYTAFAQDGQAAFYVFAMQPRGFVIVSADDRAKPILGYSTESNFTSLLPDGLMTFFENYKAGFSQMFAHNEERTAEAVDDWTSLEKTGKLSASRTDRSVGPLLASIWNQTDLYNNLAPEDPSSVYSGHCKSGCVANTMSQIMRYWEWPRHGQGGHGYDANSYYGNYGWQEANFEDATYRFELMPDFLDFASPQVEVDATALLEYHAGVSVDMGYGPNASGAYSYNVGPAMLEYFRYSPDLEHRDKPNSGSNTQWKNDLRTNLDAGMPVYYASQGEAGGHAYVLDGYDTNDMFHLNWGWAGFDNGYYTIDGFYLTFYSFPWYHNAIFNLHPDDEYYDAPMAVESLEAYAHNGSVVVMHIAPVLETRAGEPLDDEDVDVYIMRDGVVIDSVMDYSWSQNQYVYFDHIEKAGTYYYAVYAVNDAGMSKVTRDTVTIGRTCDLRFELADTGGNGWDMSSIAVLDEDGKVSQRVGLWEGGEASVVVPVPNNQTATFFWTYDNTCYSHGSLSEVSYEIYDWDDNLIVASDGYPEVGEMIDYEINCEMDCQPVFNLEGVYEWHNEEEYGAMLTWDWDGNEDEFVRYEIYNNTMLITTIGDLNYKSIFFAFDFPITMDFEVSVLYRRESGEQCTSDPVSVTVEVTSIPENDLGYSLYPNPASDRFTIEGKVKEVKAFDALGQLVYQGEGNVVEVAAWPKGVYFVRVMDENNGVSTVKFIKE